MSLLPLLRHRRIQTACAGWILALFMVFTTAVPAAASDSGQDAAAAKPSAIDSALEDQPGFFDFTQLKMFGPDDLEIHISIKGPLLSLVAAASGDREPDLASILKKLKGVEVRVYNLSEDNRDRARNTLDGLAGKLKKQKWVPAITVQVQRDHGYAFLRYQDNGSDPVGLAAMYLTEENQAVFVNIVGSMNTATIGRLARRFDLDLLAVSDP